MTSANQKPSRQTEDAQSHRLQRLVSLNGRTVWRDAKGKITHPGSCVAITATTEAGNVWDVSTDTFRLRACIGRQQVRANAKAHRSAPTETLKAPKLK